MLFTFIFLLLVTQSISFHGFHTTKLQYMNSIKTINLYNNHNQHHSLILRRSSTTVDTKLNLFNSSGSDGWYQRRISEKSKEQWIREQRIDYGAKERAFH
jgi:hypothetical protein